MRALTPLAPLALFLLSACAEPELILQGERFDVRSDLNASLPTDENPNPQDPAAQRENRSLSVSLPQMSANADWTHRGGNLRHLPGHGALSAAPQRIFSVKIGAGNSRKNRVSVAPIVAGGRVFALDAAARLSAVSTSGALLWSKDLAPSGESGPAVSGGGLAFGGGRLLAATGYGEVLALDPASGAVLWRQRLGASVAGAPAVEGARVYLTGRDSYAWALDAETGRVIWTLPGAAGGAGMLGSAAPALTATLALMPTDSGDLIAALKGSGVEVWRRTIGGARRGRAFAGIPDITGDPVVAGGVTYAGNASGKTYALKTATGEVLWIADEGALGPVLPVGGDLFLVNDEAQLVRLEAGSGARVWAVDMPYYQDGRPSKRRAITAHYGPVLAGGRLVVASGDGLLRFFAPEDGAFLGSLAIPGGAASQPALAEGKIFVLGGDGQLHAYR